MVTVYVVEVAVDQIIDVIAMRYRFVSAARTMDMVCIVSITAVFWCTYVWILIRDCDDVLVDMSVVRVV